MAMVQARRTMAKRTSRAISQALVYILLIVGGIVVCFPILWMVGTSLKELPQTRAYPPVWIPDPVRLDNYPTAFTFLPFATFFRNTFIIAGLVVVGDLLSCSFVAYGFARFRFPGRNILFMVLMSTMMVPFIVRLVPLFLVFKHLGWINTFLPLVVPSFFGTPFFIFLMRQFFLTIPSELADAARIDGASEIGIWWRIYLPLSGPVLSVVAIMAFQQTWHDFLAPLVFINDTDKFTAALGLVHMLSQSGASTEYWNLLMAVATMMVVPMVIIFAAAQRYLVQGIALTGIKG